MRKASVVMLAVFLIFVINVSGCLSPGQILDKGINETVDVAGEVTGSVWEWFQS